MFRFSAEGSHVDLSNLDPEDQLVLSKMLHRYVGEDDCVGGVELSLQIVYYTVRVEDFEVLYSRSTPCGAGCAPRSS